MRTFQEERVGGEHSHREHGSEGHGDRNLLSVDLGEKFTVVGPGCVPWWVG